MNQKLETLEILRARHERKLEEIDSQPRQRMQQVTTAILAALAGGIISTVVDLLQARYEAGRSGDDNEIRRLDNACNLCGRIIPIFQALLAAMVFCRRL